jgi:hypothetical protein
MTYGRAMRGRRKEAKTNVKIKKAIAAGLMTAAMVTAPMSMASADGILSKVLTGAAGIIGVKLIAGPLNTFIDHILLTNNIANQGKTKVVPIVQTGSSTYVGAAQVSGPAYAVDRVQAVGALAFDWNNGVWKGSILIPIDSLNPLKGFKRVYGVGVDAVINARL